MSLFQNLFFRCSDGDIDGSEPFLEGKIECSGTFGDDGVLKHRSWTAPASNFDGFNAAFWSLCRVFTLKWVSTWTLCQESAAKEHLQPVTQNSTIVGSSFMIVFIFFGSFFCLNLFVSFIVDGFYAAQGVEAQSEAIKYAMIMKMISENWPQKITKPPQNPLSQVLLSSDTQSLCALNTSPLRNRCTFL